MTEKKARPTAAAYVLAAIAVVITGWWVTEIVTERDEAARNNTGSHTEVLAKLVDEAERLARAVAEEPPGDAASGTARLSREEALWALCWHTTEGMNKVLTRTTLNSKIALLGDLYPTLIDTCIDGVAGRARAPDESR